MLAWCAVTTDLVAQSTPDTSVATPPVQTVSAQPPLSAAETPATDETEEVQEAEPTPPKKFLLPSQHHPWAKFQPGAWRDIEITTETFDGQGNLISRSVTTQREVLATVATEKYVLNVRATIEMVGKRFVGDWKKSVRNLATDLPGEVTDSQRGLSESTVDGDSDTDTESQIQNWEISYRDGARSRVDSIRYDPNQFPHVIRRKTIDVLVPEDEATPTEQLMQVLAHSVPFQLDQQLLACSYVQTKHQHEKGGTQRFALLSSVVPGGEVAAWTTDFDTAGKKVRWSTTQVRAYGLSAPLEP